MLQISELDALRDTVRGWRRQGLRIGFVPTMGNLHEGHLHLVRSAAARCDRVISSIFVNPTQFGPNEDFSRYPRTPQEDATRLAAEGCHALFLPSVATMYPLGTEGCVRVEVPGLSDVLCGAHRPGHFAGVATVVTRLLNMVQADVAVFGRKDLQQLELIRHLVHDLAIPVEVVGERTQREADGLARSSRNQYLSAVEREQAVELSRALAAVLDGLAAGRGVYECEREAERQLHQAGFVVDYIALRREGALDLVVSDPSDTAGLVVLGAARLGRTRLIDNLAWHERFPLDGSRPG